MKMTTMIQPPSTCFSCKPRILQCLTSVPFLYVSSSLFPLKTLLFLFQFSHFQFLKFPISSSSTSMADFQQQNQPTHERRPIPSDKAPSTSQLLALLTLLPIGAFLLFLAGISFIGTVIGLAVSSPLLVIFSPILIPAAVVIALAVAGFLTSGAFGVTALSSLSWMANNLRRSRVPLQLEQAKQWVREKAAQAAQTAKEAGQAIQSKAQDGGKSEEVGPAQEGGRTEEVGSAQEGGRAERGALAQEGGTAQEKSTAAEDESAQEGVKAQEGGKAQGGGKT